VRPRLAALAALLPFALSALPGTAAAQGLVARLPGLGPTAFTFTNTSLLRYRGSNFDLNRHDDQFGSFTERLDIAATSAPWRLYLRVDGFSPFNHDTSCTEDEVSLCYLRSNYRPGSYDSLGTSLPERLSLRYQRGDITAEAGDFYQVFGRGLSLAFRKVDPIGLDTTLRGGRLEIDRGRLTARGFAGLSNPQNLDPISLSIFEDPRDLLAGGSLSARVGPDEDIEVSGHVVHAGFEALADQQRQDDVDVAGVRVEFPSLLDGALTLYGEMNILRRASRLGRASQDDSLPVSRSTNGRGVYVAAQLIRGRFTVLAEWKDYTHYLIAPTESSNSAPRDVARVYSAAPSLERDDQRIFTNANTRGGRLRVDYTVAPSPWIFTFNTVMYGWADTADSLGNELDPWDPSHGLITSHTYFAVRRRSRPAPRAAAPPAAAADTGAPARGGGAPAAAASAGGVVPGAAGVGGASVTRVARGDFNLVASVGYRREFYAGSDQTSGTLPPQWQAGDVKHESIQADFDIAVPVGSNDSLELRVDHRFERNYTAEALTGFNLEQLTMGARGGVSLSWSHGLPLVVSASLRWDNTTRPIGQRGLGDDSFGVVGAGVPLLPVLFPSAEVRWNFTLSNFVRVFGGMTPGGRVCSGGVCRDVPLFQGAIAELVLRI
jgi:hypothetical protein